MQNKSHAKDGWQQHATNAHSEQTPHFKSEYSGDGPAQDLPNGATYDGQHPWNGNQVRSDTWESVRHYAGEYECQLQ